MSLEQIGNSLAKRSSKSESKYLTKVGDRVIINFLRKNIRKKQLTKQLTTFLQYPLFFMKRNEVLTVIMNTIPQVRHFLLFKRSQQLYQFFVVYCFGSNLYVFVRSFI